MMRRMNSSPLLLAGFVLFSAAPLASAERTALSAARESITKGEMSEIVGVLADDTLEGREGGSRGGRAAGNYLLKQLGEFGLSGGGDRGGFVQEFPGGQRNVLAVLPGGDERLKREYIVVSAHYDHVGYGNRTNSYGPIGYIHNGADDNASGVAGLLELIEALTALPTPPRRSILFAFWDGEEKGLLGSQHWVDHPTLPLEQVACMVNMDMIGRLRNRRVEVFGTRTCRGLRRLVSFANADQDLNLDFTWLMKEDSDHYSFYIKGVPAMMLHTGLHDDYHRPSDDPERLNTEGMEEVARLLFSVVYSLAESDAEFSFRRDSRRENPDRQRVFEQPLAALPPRLGVRWQADADAGQGVVITEITRGSPAEKAGLAPGDRIVRIDHRPIASEQDLLAAVAVAPSAAEFEFVRAGESKKTAVALDGSPVRVGVNWREDSASPGAVMLTRVVSGSPAQLAGLLPGDRLYQADGRSFASGDELLEIIDAVDTTLEVLMERRGRLRTVTLDIPKP